MNKADLNEFDVLVMIDQTTGALFPFSSHGFQYADGKHSSLIKRSSSYIFLDSKGFLHRIRKVHPRTNDFAAKLKRFASLAYQVETDLEPIEMELCDIKQLILNGIADYKSQLDEDEEWTFITRPLSEIEPLVLNTADARSLYMVLELPNAVDCLDLL